MRGTDTFAESLFTIRRLDDFVPKSHPLRSIRTMANQALVKMDRLLAQMYEADIKSGRPSIAPEKSLRAMLLQVLYSMCFGCRYTRGPIQGGTVAIGIRSSRRKKPYLVAARCRRRDYPHSEDNGRHEATQERHRIDSAARNSRLRYYEATQMTPYGQGYPRRLDHPFPLSNARQNRCRRPSIAPNLPPGTPCDLISS